MAFLSSVFLLGGGSRNDVQSLILLRPLAIIACGYGLWCLRPKHISEFRFAFGFAAVLFAFVAIQLVPLPASIWGELPGRELIVDSDRVAGLGEVWRPISLTPTATWNSLYALFVPLGVLLIGAQLPREDRYGLLPLLLGFGIVSGLMGLFQVISSPTGSLYLFRITNNGSAVGLFSNRNHQAILLACMFPITAAYASTGARSAEQVRFRLWSAIAIVIVLIPLILVTGSRTGLAVALIGLVGGAALYRKLVVTVPAKRKVARFNMAYIFSGLSVVGLGILTTLLAKAEAIERLLAPDQVQDLRFAIWKPAIEAGMKYFPIGSGAGSFVEIYQIDEQTQLLSPQYINHAHNDWIEIFITGGLFGLGLAIVAAVALVRSGYNAWFQQPKSNRSTLYMRLGSVILAILALSSVTDYPLRVPSIMAFAMVAVLWVHHDRDNPKPGLVGPANRDGSPSDTSLADPT